MEKTPFIVSVRYREVTQPQQYHSQEAEVSAQFSIGDDKVDPQGVIEDALTKVKRQVRIALGKEAGELVAVAADPEKRGRGRPPKPKAEEPKEVLADPTTGLMQPVEPEALKEYPAPAPSADDDFGDTSEAEKPKEITDTEIQVACREAVAKGGGKLLAADVKNMARLKYGTDKVTAIKQPERAGFLADLKNLVAEKTGK